MDRVGIAEVEVIEETASWYEGLAREKPSCGCSNSILAVMHARLDQEQRGLEAEEEALRAQVELVRGGRAPEEKQMRAASELLVTTKRLAISVATGLSGRLAAIADAAMAEGCRGVTTSGARAWPVFFVHGRHRQCHYTWSASASAMARRRPTRDRRPPRCIRMMRLSCKRTQVR